MTLLFLVILGGSLWSPGMCLELLFWWSGTALHAAPVASVAYRLTTCDLARSFVTSLLSYKYGTFPEMMPPLL